MIRIHIEMNDDIMTRLLFKLIAEFMEDKKDLESQSIREGSNPSKGS